MNVTSELLPPEEIETVVETGTQIRNALPPIEQLDSLRENVTAYSSSPMFVASFFIFVLFFIVFIFMNNLIKNGKEPIEILKTFGIPLIVASSVFIVITGLGMDTLTPVIGLLGTIAGYLLGQKEKKL